MEYVKCPLPWPEIARNSEEGEMITGLVKEDFLRDCDLVIKN